MSPRTAFRADTPTHPYKQGGVVGPNSVLQLAAALRAEEDGLAEHVFAAAGFLALLSNPPEEMIDERVPAALFAAMRREIPEAQAARIAYDAGSRTADYVIAHRIPGPAKTLLRTLPLLLAAPVLLRAIEKNAWTFAGSGLCRVGIARPWLIEIKDNPLAMPDCHWHRAVFERLFAVLVGADMTTTHPTCCHRGDGTCRFHLSTPLK